MRRGAGGFARVLVWLLACAVPAVAGAQGAVGAAVHAEVRVDAITDGSATSVQVGAGVQIPAGYYARIGIVGAVGGDAVVRDGQGRSGSGRVDVIGRFLLDPFRDARWGLSAGAGVSVRGSVHAPLRPYLVTVVDVEGPRSAAGLVPAFQLGLGGGFRVGLAIRGGSKAAR